MSDIGNRELSIHPFELPLITVEASDDLAWEHAMLTWGGDTEDGIADHLEHVRSLYTNAASHSLFWSSMALHMVSGIAASTGLVLPLADGDEVDQEAAAIERLLSLADGVRAGLITTWVTRQLLAESVPTDSELIAEGLEHLDPVPLHLRFVAR